MAVMTPSGCSRVALGSGRLLLVFALLMSGGSLLAADPVKVGSKRFTESYLIGEMVTQVLVASGTAAEHRQGLGNTGILEQALVSGAIDVYPEYTGTIVRELLKREGSDDAAATLEQINRWLAPRGLKASVPLGFNNTYAIAMREADAARLGIDSLSGLAKLPTSAAAGLRLGLSHEFLVRTDGWPGLKKAYDLKINAGSGIDHGLAYKAIADGQLDIIDVYSTDAQIGRLKLRVLRDDLGYFPRYDAVLLMRATLDDRALHARLAGRLDEATMRSLNAEVEVDRRSFDQVSRDWLAKGASTPRDADISNTGNDRPGSFDRFVSRLLAPDLGRLLRQHLLLVFGSLAIATLVGIPLGVLACRRPALSSTIMALAGLLQTIPSLALLAFLIALLGTIGFLPALIALSGYALLPIVRNTHAGLQSVAPGLTEAGIALGLRRTQILQKIELPLATPMLLAGLKTAAVINVGTATVAAFVGAGGLGERIVSGLAVSDTTQMLAGAVPAALLAIVMQLVFDAAERLMRPRSSATLPTPSA
jgi:osmoprotectant transport system permease protein